MRETHTLLIHLTVLNPNTDSHISNFSTIEVKKTNVLDLCFLGLKQGM